MKTVSEKTTKTNESEVKQPLKEAFVLWKTTAKTGLNYLTGKTTEEKPAKLKAFYNTDKKNPNEPDIRVYIPGEEKDIEVASLWENISKVGDKRYFSGKTNEDEKLVGWYKDEKGNEKQPDIRVYYQN